VIAIFPGLVHHGIPDEVRARELSSARVFVNCLRSRSLCVHTPTHLHCIRAVAGVLPHARTHTHSLAHSLTHARTLTHTHTHTHSLSLTHSRMHTHTHTHTHTHAHTHAHTHTLTPALSHSPPHRLPLTTLYLCGKASARHSPRTTSASTFPLGGLSTGSSGSGGVGGSKQPMAQVLLVKTMMQPAVLVLLMQRMMQASVVVVMSHSKVTRFGARRVVV
jgi:hypothetical protein